MELFEIILTPDADKTYKVDIVGKIYDVRVRYNQRVTNKATTPIKADEFTISMALAGRDEIFETSMKTNRDLLEPYRYREGCPKGILMLRDITADASKFKTGFYAPERVSYDTLGSRFVLFYYEK